MHLACCHCRVEDLVDQLGFLGKHPDNGILAFRPRPKIEKLFDQCLQTRLAAYRHAPCSLKGLLIKLEFNSSHSAPPTRLDFSLVQ